MNTNEKQDLKYCMNCIYYGECKKYIEESYAEECNDYTEWHL